MITAKNLKVSVIIAAAGKGERAGFGINKLLAPLYGAPVLWHTIKKFDIPEVDEVVIAASECDFEEVKKLSAPFKCKVALGGNTRTESVKNALKSVTGDIVLIHDGARPFLTRELILKCLDSVVRFSSGVCAIPATDAMCTVNYGLISSVHDRTHLYRLQTPQGFFTADIKRAYELAGDELFFDDSAVYFRYCGLPHIVEGEPENRKLTFGYDFYGEAHLPIPSDGAKVGFGVDVHAFADGDGITLGGVKIPFHKKLIAHSDGDVIFHAVTDSILSGAGLEDIGHYFPVNDKKYAGANSANLCRLALQEVLKAGYTPVNISVSVQAETPKLAPYTDGIKENIAAALNIPKEDVAVAAGTCEGLGFVGEGLGIAAYSYVFLKRI